jgi:hypothetical protein
MDRCVLRLHDQAVEIHFPPSIAAEIEILARGAKTREPTPAARRITIRTAQELFSVSVDEAPPVSRIDRDDLPAFIMEAMVSSLIKDLTSGIALHAGVVAHRGRTALIAGQTGAGKSSLVAWLAASGFDYGSDEIAVLVGETEPAILGLSRPIVLRTDAAEKVLAMPVFRNADRIESASSVMVAVGSPHRPAPQAPCSLIIFPCFIPGAELSIQSMSAGQAALKLVGLNLNARNLPDGGFRAIPRFARETPAIALRYGDYSQLQGTVDVLLRFLLDVTLTPGNARRLLSMFERGRAAESDPPTSAPPPAKYEIPAPTPRRAPRKLTIGMATYDDYDGVYFTLQALRMYHPEILDDTGFLVVDNHPDGPCSRPLKMLEQSTPHFRYVPFGEYSGTAAAKERVLMEAESPYVLCLDCHVLVVPGALRRLMAYFDAHPDTPDLLQGPLVYDDLAALSTHFRVDWRTGMYGCWETDERGVDPDAPPFEIPMQGMGLFACRRKAWVGFNPRFRGFGGEEGYIHEKFRRNGARTLCLPFLRWLHRFNRPMGVPYQNRWEDRIRNYLIGFRELGLSEAGIEQHFRDVLGPQADAMIERIALELEEI